MESTLTLKNKEMISTKPMPVNPLKPDGSRQAEGGRGIGFYRNAFLRTSRRLLLNGAGKNNNGFASYLPLGYLMFLCAINISKRTFKVLLKYFLK
jgi:hypothetical protein